MIKNIIEVGRFRNHRNDIVFFCVFNVSIKMFMLIETGDRLDSSWFSISRDRFEYTVSLGHTYSYPRYP